jgi:hypothetical protein
MMAKLMPCDVYGHPDLVGSPLRAYVLGDFGPLLENPILSYPTPLLWLDPDRKTIHQFISHKDIGLWRYRLVPKHKHECCPDCGLDRHEIEELEKRVRSLESELLKFESQEESDAKNARLERLESQLSERDEFLWRAGIETHTKAILKLGEIKDRLAAIESGTAPGILTKIASLADQLHAQAQILIGYQAHLHAIARDLMQQGSMIEHHTLRLKAIPEGVGLQVAAHAINLRHITEDLEQLIKATNCHRKEYPAVAAIPAKPAIPAHVVIEKVAKSKD